MGLDPITGALLGKKIFGGDSGGKKKDAGYDAYKALQYQKAPTDTTMMSQSSVPSLMPKEARIKQSRTNSLNAMRAGSFGLMK